MMAFPVDKQLLCMFNATSEFLHMSETAALGRFREFSLQSNFGSCPHFSPAFPLLLQLWYPTASKNITLQLFTRGRWRNCIKSPSDRKGASVDSVIYLNSQS
ncbi:uncharacterized protein M8220_001745 isoform 2-T4 [Acridotheres tristis]